MAVVWALLNLIFNAPFIFPALGYPNSFFDFGLGVPIILYLIPVVIGGIVAYVQHHRGSTRTEVTEIEQYLFAAITAVVVALMVTSGVLHIVSLESVSAEDKAGSILMDMKETKFVPDQLRIPAGKPATLLVRNRDFVVHTFTIEELGIDVSFVPGTEKLVEVPASLAGKTLKLVCTIPGHDEMKGTLTVAR